MTDNDTRPPTMAGFTITVILVGAAPWLLLVPGTFAPRVGLAICWVFGFLGTIACLGLLVDSEEMRAMRARVHKRPRWARRILTGIDVPVLVVLAGLGHWFTFALFALQAFLSVVVEQRADHEAQTEHTTSAGGTN